ncbi:MAG: hypothetical protein ACFE9S_03550 [Candidatus Hermodarchaeota archaeon]
MLSIFQIDWISVDIVIIILLLLLLICVKIFKITHRWRYSFSNEDLINISFSTSQKKENNQIILTKKLCLTRKSSIKEISDNIPLVLIFRRKNKGKLYRICTEGLASYGFDVINIKAKFKTNPDDVALEKNFIDEWKTLISNILDKFKMREVKIKTNYIIIDYSKNLLNYKQILTKSEIKGIISINPKINKSNFLKYHKLSNSTYINSKIYTIFSGRSVFFFKNKHLNKFLNSFFLQKHYNLKHLIIDNARNSFKYYETILLGIIIDIIENRLLKS